MSRIFLIKAGIAACRSMLLAGCLSGLKADPEGGAEGGRRNGRRR
jgi:hypothetical protein